MGSRSSDFIVVQLGNQQVPDNGNGNLTVSINGASIVIPNIIKGNHVNVLGTSCWEGAILELVVIFCIQVNPCQSKL